MAEDYYELLGVDPDAPREESLRAYRRRAAEHHPDVSDAPDAEGTFKRLTRAKSVLADEERRREYDRLGHDRFVEVGQGDPPSGDAGRRDSNPDSDPLDGSRQHSPPRAAEWFVSPPEWGREPSFGRLTDLRALFGGPGRGKWPNSAGAPRTECPRCGGRGRFIHLIDTARGQQRRLERCERCGGEGAVPA